MLRYKRSATQRTLQVIALSFISSLSLNTWSAAPPLDPSGMDNLRQSSANPVDIRLDRATGTVSFLTLRAGDFPLDPAVRQSPPVATMEFLERYASLFGLRQPTEELQVVREFTDALGYQHVFYQQIFQGIPVFGSDFRSHFDASGELIRINASTIPITRLDTTPLLDATQAEATAVAEIQRTARQRTAPVDLEGFSKGLFIFRSGMLQGASGRNHLAYQVEVRNPDRSSRDFVFVDAHTGDVIDRISGIHESINRQIYNGGLKQSSKVWSEGNTLPFAGADAVDINHLIDYAEDTYNLFRTLSDGVYSSYDGADASMLSVLNEPSIPCPNANWNGVSTNYCTGVTGDDTVSHEWTHAYTEYTHNLVYQWQPGALNESYSDVFGEIVDMLNGAGSDSPNSLRTADGSACSIYGAGSPSADDSYRWLSGEDDTATGAIRDLWRPECYNDPGKVSSNRYWCLATDEGGVHTNSGVPNHAFSMLVDGGTYNGETIAGIGLTKAAHIYWRAMTVYQGPVSDFADHADALQAACGDLVGAVLPALSTETPQPSSSGQAITSNDCVQVNNAVTAVELRQEPVQCPFETIIQPYPLELCFGHGEMATASFTDWESDLGDWTVSHIASKPSTFDIPDWAVVANLPDQRPGLAAFVADPPDAGDCLSDDVSGVLRLESPLISIPQGTVVPRISIDHWLATEHRYDGGNLKISVNGGAFSLIPKSAIDFSPYNETLYTLIEGNSNPLAGEDVYSGTDEGKTSGSWGKTLINLYELAAAGDTIRLRFDFGIDGCSGVEGWYVDEVRVYSCSAELPASDCGNGVLDTNEQCDDGNTFIADGCSNSCEIEPGWQCTAPSPPGEIQDPGFEAGPDAVYWTEMSTQFGTPICDLAACGNGGGTGAAEGVFWSWFGGYDQGSEEASIAQTVTIPSGATELQFELEINACDSVGDYLEVLIDGNQEFLVDGSNSMCNMIGYTTQVVDISAYADDGLHSLVFHSQTFANNGDVSNFFVDELSIPGSVSQCIPAETQLILIKEVSNDNGGTALPSAWTLSASGPTPFSGNGPTVQSGLGFQAGTYTLSESGGSAGYIASDWVCTGGTQDDVDTITVGQGQAVTCTITNDDIAPTLTLVKHLPNDNGGTASQSDFQAYIDDKPVNWDTPVTLTAGLHTASEDTLSGYQASGWSNACAADGSVTLNLGDELTCEITNDDIAPTLTLVKHLPNGDGGSASQNDFQAYIDGNPVGWDTPITLTAGLHAASEDTLSGYQASGWSNACAADGSVTLNLGDELTCEITNDDIAPTLTLVKHLPNDNGGTASKSDFQAYIDGSPVDWDTPVTLTAGLHAASEDTLTGYQASGWSNACAADGSVTLNLGDELTCEITNDDIAPTLTLVKHLPNDDGGLASQSDFQAYIDGNPVDWDTPIPLAAGAHSVSEDTLPGYVPTGWSNACTANGMVTLNPGDVLTCEITNDDIAPTLTLVKHLPNDNGGTASKSDFQAYIDGNPVGWDTPITLTAGLHTASEDTLSGYQASGWSNACTANGMVTLNPGDVLTCEITNDDAPPGLTLVKVVTTDDGGTDLPSDWTLTATGPSTFSGSGPTVSSGEDFAPGSYDLSESGPTGYQASDWVCVGGTQDDPDTVAVGLGETVTCTITNDDIPPTLTLVKHLPNDDGGTATEADFQAYIDDNPVDWNTPVTLMAGTHTATEVTLPDYQASGWSNACAPDGSVTLYPGDDLTCEITNDDISLDSLIYADGFESD